MADLVAPRYDSAGVQQGEVLLDPAVFGITPNRDVMHQVVVAHLAARRSGTARTKTRAEVRGGGRKPWRQKGLGRARHGSIRSPIWVGGGKAHGPRDRNYVQRAPKKMKALALRSALSARASEGAIKIIGGFDWEVPRTSLAVSLLSDIGATGKALVVVDRSEEIAVRSFRNLPQVILGRPGMLNTYDVLWAGTVVFSGLALGQASTGPDGSPSGRFDVSDEDFVMENGAAPAGLGREAS